MMIRLKCHCPITLFLFNIFIELSKGFSLQYYWVSCSVLFLHVLSEVYFYIIAGLWRKWDEFKRRLSSSRPVPAHQSLIVPTLSHAFLCGDFLPPVWINEKNNKKWQKRIRSTNLAEIVPLSYWCYLLTGWKMNILKGLTPRAAPSPRVAPLSLLANLIIQYNWEAFKPQLRTIIYKPQLFRIPPWARVFALFHFLIHLFQTHSESAEGPYAVMVGPVSN